MSHTLSFDLSLAVLNIASIIKRTPIIDQSDYTEHVLGLLVQSDSLVLLFLYASDGEGRSFLQSRHCVHWRRLTSGVATSSVAIQEPPISSCIYIVMTVAVGARNSLLKAAVPSAAAQQQLTVYQRVYFIHVLERTLWPFHPFLFFLKNFFYLATPCLWLLSSVLWVTWPLVHLVWMWVMALYWCSWYAFNADKACICAVLFVLAGPITLYLVYKVRGAPPCCLVSHSHVVWFS